MTDQQTIHILLVEDNPGDARLMQEIIKETTLRAELTHVMQLSEIETQKNKTPQYDLIMLDLNLPDSEGLKTVLSIQKILPNIPIVVTTGLDNEELSLASIKSGAQDYLVKGKIDAKQMQKTIQYALGRYQILQEINELNDKEKIYLSTHDDLTKLLNEQAFIELLKKVIEQHEVVRKTCALVLIEFYELDKILNNYGYLTKGQVIKSIADRLSESFEGIEIGCAYLNNNQFAVLLVDILDIETLEQLILNLKKSLLRNILIRNQRYVASYNIGIIIFDSDNNQPELLFKNARKALSKSREQGIYKYEFYSSKLHYISPRSDKKIWDSDLNFAIERNEFFIIYQPQVNLTSNKVCGVEALLRWWHPKYGLICPDDFVPVAENNRLIIPIGEWVLETAVQHYISWQEKFNHNLSLRLAINVSAYQLVGNNLFEKTLQVLDKYKILPESLELELTESIFIGEPELMIKKLMQYRKAGLHIAIDDFGRGYSSLSYLSHLPITKLKIDMNFVQQNLKNKASVIMLKSIINLAHNLNLTVIAEGVETKEQCELLKQLQCDEVQGFYFSGPLGHDNFLRFLIDYNKF